MGLTPSRFRRHQAHLARYGPVEHEDVQLARSDREMPAHWNFDFGWAPWPLNEVLKKGFQMLCLVSLGHADLETLHYVCVASEKTWMESTERLADRLNTITVVVSTIRPGVQRSGSKCADPGHF